MIVTSEYTRKLSEVWISCNVINDRSADFEKEYEDTGEHNLFMSHKAQYSLLIIILAEAAKKYGHEIEEHLETLKIEAPKEEELEEDGPQKMEEPKLIEVGGLKNVENLYSVFVEALQRTERIPSAHLLERLSLEAPTVPRNG